MIPIPYTKYTFQHYWAGLVLFGSFEMLGMVLESQNPQQARTDYGSSVAKVMEESTPLPSELRELLGYHLSKEALITYPTEFLRSATLFRTKKGERISDMVRAPDRSLKILTWKKHSNCCLDETGKLSSTLQWVIPTIAFLAVGMPLGCATIATCDKLFPSYAGWPLCRSDWDTHPLQALITVLGRSMLLGACCAASCLFGSKKTEKLAERCFYKVRMYDLSTKTLEAHFTFSLLPEPICLPHAFFLDNDTNTIGIGKWKSPPADIQYFRKIPNRSGFRRISPQDITREERAQFATNHFEFPEGFMQAIQISNKGVVSLSPEQLKTLQVQVTREAITLNRGGAQYLNQSLLTDIEQIGVNQFATLEEIDEKDIQGHLSLNRITYNNQSGKWQKTQEIHLPSIMRIHVRTDENNNERYQSNTFCSFKSSDSSAFLLYSYVSVPYIIVDFNPILPYSSYSVTAHSRTLQQCIDEQSIHPLEELLQATPPSNRRKQQYYRNQISIMRLCYPHFTTQPIPRPRKKFTWLKVGTAALGALSFGAWLYAKYMSRHT